MKKLGNIKQCLMKTCFQYIHLSQNLIFSQHFKWHGTLVCQRTFFKEVRGWWECPCWISAQPSLPRWGRNVSNAIYLLLWDLETVQTWETNATLITSIKVFRNNPSYLTYNMVDYGGSLNKMSSNSHFTVLPNLCFVCSCSPWNNAEMVASGASDSTRATPTSSGP